MSLNRIVDRIIAACPARAMLILALLAATASCRDEGPMERAGRNVDRAVSDTGETVEDSLEDAGEAIEEFFDDAGDAVEDATRRRSRKPAKRESVE